MNRDTTNAGFIAVVEPDDTEMVLRIQIPTKTLKFAAENHPENNYQVIDEKLFAQKVGDYLNKECNDESGLSRLQKLCDEIFNDLVEDAQDDAIIIKE
jgi:hypothetical protein